MGVSHTKRISGDQDVGTLRLLVVRPDALNLAVCLFARAALSQLQPGPGGAPRLYMACAPRRTTRRILELRAVLNWYSSRFKNNHFTEMCCGTEAGSYLRLIDSCITQIKAQRPSRTCNESKEEDLSAGLSVPDLHSMVLRYAHLIRV